MKMFLRASALALLLVGTVLPFVQQLTERAFAQQITLSEELRNRWTNAQIADGFSAAPVQKAQELRIYFIADPRATDPETSCVKDRLLQVLSDWTGPSQTPLRFVADFDSANLIVNFDSTIHSFQGSIDARVARADAGLASFLSSESRLPALGEYIRSVSGGRGWLRVEHLFDIPRVHSAFFVRADDTMELGYVWYRDDSVTGESARGGWPRGPYGVPAPASGSCYPARQRVAAIELALAHAVGAAVTARTNALPSGDQLGAGVPDGRNRLLAQLLFHRDLVVGLSASEIKRRVERVLE